MTFVVDHMGIGFRGLDFGGRVGGDDVEPFGLVQLVGQLADERLARPLAADSGRSKRTADGPIAHGRIGDCACGGGDCGLRNRDAEVGRRPVLSIAGFAVGLLLGLYALGLISQRMSESTALVAFTIGVVSYVLRRLCDTDQRLLVHARGQLA